LSLDPYTLLPRTPFYLFYYNITNNIIIKTKLEEFVIEPYFSYISEEENKETREYLHVNTVDLENSVNGNTVPPQKHTVLRNMVNFFCYPTGWGKENFWGGSAMNGGGRGWKKVKFRGINKKILIFWD